MPAVGSEIDPDIAGLKVGSQFWAVSSTIRTPYVVTAVKHCPGANKHVWAEIRAWKLSAASKPFNQMLQVGLHAPHGNSVVLRRQIK